MTPEDFFIDSGPGRRTLNWSLLELVRSGAYTNRSDVEVGTALLRLAHDELAAYGTNSTQRTSEDDIRHILQTCRRLMKRIGVDLELPFSDFRTFRSHWLANGAYNSWQARRDILNDLFEPAHRELVRLEDDEIESTLARRVTSHPGTGWSRVDAEINELRRHFKAARSPQDYRNIGNDCIAVLEKLSAAVFDPGRHLKEDEDELPVAKTKTLRESQGGSLSPTQQPPIARRGGDNPNRRHHCVGCHINRRGGVARLVGIHSDDHDSVLSRRQCTPRPARRLPDPTTRSRLCEPDRSRPSTGSHTLAVNRKATPRNRIRATTGHPRTEPKSGKPKRVRRLLSGRQQRGGSGRQRQTRVFLPVLVEPPVVGLRRPRSDRPEGHRSPVALPAIHWGVTVRQGCGPTHDRR